MAFAPQADEDNAKLRLMSRSSKLHDGEMVVIPKEISDVYRLTDDDTDITMSNTDDNNNDTPMAMNAGELEKFPLEILIEVLSKLDLKSLFKMRSVSRYLKQVIDHSMISYHHSAKHAPHALAAMNHTDMAKHFTMNDFSAALYSTTCTECGHYGQFLHLPSCTRCCYPCLKMSAKYLPLFRGAARAGYGLDIKTVNALPILRTIPGVYGVNRKNYKRRFNLVDQVAAYNAGIKLHGSVEAMKSHARDPPQGDWLTTTSSRRQLHGVREMTAIFFPSFEPRTQIVEWGVCCTACKLIKLRYEVSWRAYTRKEFLQNHSPSCECLEEIWECYRRKRAPANGYMINK